MILHARLLWSIKFPGEICYTFCILMYVWIKVAIKNDRFHIEKNLYYSCTFVVGVCGHAPMRKIRKIKQFSAF